MSIFSRRLLQRIIDENAHFLPPRQNRDLVSKLNRMHIDQTLSPEWEVVLLYGFSNAGRVFHERDFGGSKRADIYLELAHDPDKNFIADITTVSDKGLEELNPFMFFWLELMRRVKEQGVRGESFSVDIDGIPGSRYGSPRKAKLKLPGRARFAETIFNKDFDRFMADILADPTAEHSYSVKTSEIGITIGYNPAQPSGGGGFLDYTQVFSIEENLIYQALLSKVDQLEGTGFKGPMGIMLCDGGCSFFNRSSFTGLAYSFDDVVKTFLFDNPSIGFVVTFGIERENQYALASQENPERLVIGYYRGKEFDNLEFDLPEILSKVGEALPEPQKSARSALNWLKGEHAHQGRSHWGGWSMSVGKTSGEIKISARALLDLLAGRVDPQEFLKRHNFGIAELEEFDPAVNPFANALDQYQLISEVTLEKSSTEDDDWITFKLKGPDAAVAPFVAPPSNTN
jgi:hypothetical protein